ncbi:FAD-dependent oxidoreductase [Euzebya sp.]|uniref:FAD-dependent oxidoreductase n=1 Tax=Euzebya sp. TaxID=1971409 RepID=UPI0035165354
MARAVVIGGDAAGATAAVRIKDSVPDAEVVVLEKGSWTSYSACGIPYLVAGDVEQADALVARSPAEHRERGLVVRLHTTATAIDREGRVVHTMDAETGETGSEPYDVLVYATGAHPRTPPVEGLDQFGVPVHTLDEGVALRDRLVARDISHVAVLGAGYIGIELAEALAQRGLSATLIDRGEEVMRTLDADMAALIRERVIELGIDVRLGEEVAGVEREGDRCRAVRTRRVGSGGDGDGAEAEPVRAEVVVIALGSRPRVDLARDAGLAIGPSGAVAVDERMRTDDERIWAVGDCAESRHLLTGRGANVQLGTHANKHGKVAGLDAAAFLTGSGRGEAVFPGVVGSAVTRLCGLEIGRTGLTEREATAAGVDHRAVVVEGTIRSGYMPDAGWARVKLLAEPGTGRVLGGQIVGNGPVAKRIDVVAVWCHVGTTVQEAQMMDLSYAPPFGGAWDLWQVAARKAVGQLGLSPAL